MLGLDVALAYLYTKFDKTTVSRSRDMVGACQKLNVSRGLTMPLSGWLAIHGLALAMISLSTKFQVTTKI